MTPNKEKMHPKAAQTDRFDHRLQVLIRQLAEAETELEALTAGQGDAVIDPVSATPILMRQAQAALRESENRYRTLLEAMSEGLAVSDSNDLLTYANPRFCWMMQIEPADVVGKKFANLLPELTRSRWLKQMARGKQGHATSFDLEIVRKDGSHLFVAVTINPLLDEQNKSTGLLSVLTDITERKEAEESLKASEARLRMALEVSKTIAFEQDENLVYTAIYNPHPAFSDAHVLGQTDAGLLPPESTAVLEAIKQRVLETGVSARQDVKVTIGSESIYYDLIVEPKWNPQGQICGLACATTNITGRKKAEELVKQNKALLRDIIDLVPQLIFVKDWEGRFLLVNHAGAQFGGKTVEEMTGHLESEWVTDPAVLGWIQAEDREVITSGLPKYSPEVAITDAHDQEHIMQVIKIPFEYQPGKKGVLGVATQITQLKQTEEELRRSEERFRTSVENMLDPFGIYTALRDESGQIVDFRVEYVNAAACAANMMNKEEQIGHRLLEILPAHKESGLFDEYCQLVENGRPIVKEALDYEDVYGSDRRLLRAFDIRAVKIGDGFAVTWRDVTQNKQRDDQLKASLAEKEVLLRELHHRVKNNLEVIISLAQLQMDTLSDARAIANLRELQGRARAIALIHENLHQSKKMNRVSADTFLDQLTGNLFQIFGGLGIQLRTRAPDTTLDVDTAIPIGLIITELVTNAFKYAFPPDAARDADEAEIWVNLKADAGWVVLEVGDNGVGLPSDLDWQMSGTLGMRLVKRLAKQLRAELAIHSPPGTRYCIKFKAG